MPTRTPNTKLTSASASTSSSASPLPPGPEDAASSNAADARSTPAGVIGAGLLALFAVAATAWVLGSLALQGFGRGNVAVIAAAIAGVAGALLPFAIAAKAVTPLAARLRVLAELDLLVLLIVGAVAGGPTLGALREAGGWPLRVVGRDGAPMTRAVDDVLAAAGVSADVSSDGPGDDAPAPRKHATNKRAPADKKLSAKEVFARSAKSVVVINVKKGLAKNDPLAAVAKAFGVEELEVLGSGFFVGDNLVITNDHVVDGAATLRVRTKEKGDIKTAKILAVDPRNDLALLEVEAAGIPALPLADTGADVGDDAIAIGSPLGLEYTLTTGLVSGKRELDGTHFLQVQTTIAPGSSGGPLLDDHGRVIGVNTATRGAGLNLAVDASYVSALLKAPRVAQPALAAWVDDPLVLTSLEFAGDQPLPTVRSTMSQALALLAKAVDGCVEGDADITFSDGAIQGASEKKIESCINDKTSMLRMFLFRMPSDGPRPDGVTATYQHGADRHVVLHVPLKRPH